MTSEIKEIVNRMSLLDVWNNLGCILSSGLDIDYLLELGEPQDGYFAENSRRLLNIGADPQKLFQINEEWYLNWVACPEEMNTIIGQYRQYGLDEKFIKEWKQQHNIHY